MCRKVSVRRTEIEIPCHKERGSGFRQQAPIRRLAAAHSRLLNASRWEIGAYVYVPESVSAGH